MAWLAGAWVIVMPAHLEEAVKKIQDTNLICPPILTQIAANAALGAGREWCQAKSPDRRCSVVWVLGELSRLGDRECMLPDPGGAFLRPDASSTRTKPIWTW